jgi:hypothetical protein
MKTTLHKTPQGFVLTSDENIDYSIGTNYFNNVEKCFGKIIDDIHLYKIKTDSRFEKIIAQQPQLDFSDLKPEEQKRIGWFDFEKLAEEILNNC